MKNNFKFIVAIAFLIFIFVISWHSVAYAKSSDINPLDVLSNNLAPKLPGVQNIGTTAPLLPKLSNNLFNFGNGDWSILKTGDLSFADLPGFLKSVAVLAINLFLIVIQTTAAILKVLLPFLQ